jgi:hypothetical protein
MVVFLFYNQRPIFAAIIPPWLIERNCKLAHTGKLTGQPHLQFFH